MRLNAKQIALYTGGTFLIEPIDASEILCGITWDSREVARGCLYVALPGEHHDGHDFVEAALVAGARGALVSEAPDQRACTLARELGVAIIEVPNTYHAVTDLAAHWRTHLNGRVIGLTGSVGKTTTKNLVRDVASAAFSTVATTANQNNELGVPRTLLNADPDTQVVVVEMGMRGQGQIKELCEIAKPEWGLITNIGEAHLELLGSMDNIMRAKAELFEALPSGSGCAFVNFADEYAPALMDLATLAQRNVEVVAYGIDPDTTALPDAVTICVWAQDVNINSEGCAQFTLCSWQRLVSTTSTPTLFEPVPGRMSEPCHLSLRGEHNIINACAAAAVGVKLGIRLDEIAKALSEATSEAGRMELLKGRDGFVVINDAYNANPDSMKAALAMLASMEVSGKRFAVLGDMGELGATEVACHEGVGRAVAQRGIDELICIGTLSHHIAAAAAQAGMPEDHIHQEESIGGVLEALEGHLAEGDAVLIKASHFMSLDRVVEGLMS